MEGEGCVNLVVKIIYVYEVIILYTLSLFSIMSTSQLEKKEQECWTYRNMISI